MRLPNNAGGPYPWMLRPERDSDVLEECLCLFFVLGSRRYRHRKTENVARLLVGGLGKYRVFAESYRDIAHLIDSACIDARKSLTRGSTILTSLLKKSCAREPRSVT